MTCARCRGEHQKLITFGGVASCRSCVRLELQAMFKRIAARIAAAPR